mgnify:CR=1 FL=1
MRRLFILISVLALLTPATSMAQTRLYHRGDSGLAVDASIHAWNIGDRSDRQLSLGAIYTYKGFLDLGVRTGGVDEDTIENRGWTIHGRALIRDPGIPRGWGLEFRSLYHSIDSQYNIPYIPVPPFTGFAGDSVKERFLMTGFRGYHRWAAKARSRMILGVNVGYVFRKEEVLDSSDTVLLGHDFGGWTFGFDLTGVEFGWLLLSIRTEWIQDEHIVSGNKNWDLISTWTLGVLFGMNHEGGASHE